MPVAPMEETFDRLGHVRTELRMMSHASIELALPFEVSLDCISCRRRARTVVFSSVGMAGRCTPTGHEFDGRLSELESRGGVLRASFRFRYKPFVDAKYPDEGTVSRIRSRFAELGSLQLHDHVPGLRGDNFE